MQAWHELKKCDREVKRSQDIFSAKSTTARQRLTQLCAELILRDIAFAETKKVQHALWQSGFYPCIETFRTLVKRNGTSSIQTFLLFIDETNTFITQLVAQIQQRYSLHDAGCREILLHLLIFLGDLARYKAQYESLPDFKPALGYYTKALILMPDNGNPHNQLATVAVMQTNELAAVYHYYRSLAAKLPFQNSRENVKRLFEQNKIVYLDYLTKTRRPETTISTFVLHFIHLHGLIFMHASPEDFEVQCQEVAQLLAGLLVQLQVTEETLLHVTLINIMVVHKELAAVRENPEGLHKSFDYALQLTLALFKVLLEAPPHVLPSVLGPVSVGFIWINQCAELQEPKLLATLLPALVNTLSLLQRIEPTMESTFLVEDKELQGFQYISGLPVIEGNTFPQIADSNSSAAIGERTLRLRQSANWLVQSKLLALNPLTRQYYVPSASANQPTNQAHRHTLPAVPVLDDEEEIVFQGLGDDTDSNWAQ